MSFVDEVIEAINKFREKPASIMHKLEAFKKGCTRLFKKNDPFWQEIQSFIDSIETMSPKVKFQKNEVLCKTADDLLKKYLTTEKDNDYVEGKDAIKLVPSEFTEQNPCVILDRGAETPEDVSIKVLLNKTDSAKVGRSHMTNTDYTQIGIAATEEDDENCVVIIFALKNPNEGALPECDLTDLKAAFDLFDVNKIGKIDPKETIGAMRGLNFDMKNPELFKIMKELDTPENKWVDFPTFAKHIVGRITDTKSDDGLRKIFNLYVEDPDEDTITLVHLRKIVKELEETADEKEIQHLLELPGSNKAHLTFDEFKAYMNKISKEVKK